MRLKRLTKVLALIGEHPQNKLIHTLPSYPYGGKDLTIENYIQQNPSAEEYRKFVISEEHAIHIGAALPLMIANRLGYMDRQSLEEEPTPDSEIQLYIDLIVNSSSHDADYLLPDTPIKEAIFRLILANGNSPMSADQISEDLSRRWAMSAYPRNLSPHIINRILEHSSNYCIVPVPDPDEINEA